MMTATATHRDRSVRTATQWVVVLFGVWFTFGNYVLGTLIWPGTLTDPDAMHFMRLFGVIPVMVNGWHLYFHLVTGLLCLLAATSAGRARTGCVLIGLVYVATGVAGLAVSGDVYGVIMADTFGNWVHVAEGTGLLMGVLTWIRPREPRPATV